MSLFHPIFFFNDTATTEIYTLSLHDALPICQRRRLLPSRTRARGPENSAHCGLRSEEHTSELQSQFHLVCRLLLEKTKKIYTGASTPTTKREEAHIEQYSSCDSQNISIMSLS